MQKKVRRPHSVRPAIQFDRDGSPVAHEAYAKMVSQVRPLPGSIELLAHLAAEKVKFAIATRGMLAGALPLLEMLPVGKDVPGITRDQVQHAKPDPDLLLAA